ncbi:uncharacterized protein LOC103040706 [Astyanax mexicanus]|uniref:Retinoic acid receptor responder protein 2 n=1 Tax=Astyanax mexicanus TaxID=7994 RepID=W5JYX7_ASTMX|nr:uncharacterized protein LOC103040706 [Astyanax mexicanus]
MAVVLLLLALICGAFSSSEAQTDFDKLPESHRKGIELAVNQINSHRTIQQHFLFFKSLEKSDIDAGFGAKFLYHHFLLKPTTCRRGTADANHSKCAFRDDRPVIDCGICFKTFNGAIEETPKPNIHCVYKPTLTQEMVTNRIDTCNKMSYSSGSASVLLVKTNKN